MHRAFDGMNALSRLTRLRAIAIGFGLVAFLLGLFASTASASPEFCWKDSYGRGVGSIPGRLPDCPPGYTNNGLTCGRGAHNIRYPSKLAKCPAGFRNMGLTCYKGPSTYSKGCTTIFKKYPCRKGYTDNGCFCGRGARSLSHKSMVCPRGYFKGPLARCYKKCPRGYTNTGDYCHRPVSTLGMSAQRCRPGEEKRGPFRRCFPKGRSCRVGQESDAGLCYKKCKRGYSGVGPVCWGKPPRGWVNCGMGAAKDSATCASVVFDQVSSVGQTAVTIATMGGSSAATTAATSAQRASRLMKLKAQFKKLKAAFEAAKKSSPKLQRAEKAWKNSKKVRDAAKTGQKIYGVAKSDPVTTEDIVRMSAQIASIVDSSGVSATVAAYTYPKCSKYFGSTGTSPPVTQTPPPPPVNRPPVGTVRLTSRNTLCARENQTCNFTGVGMVRYGAAGKWRTRRLRGPVQCNNRTFGDPIRGTRKSCFVRAVPPRARRLVRQYCAREGKVCRFRGVAVVAYGAKNKWTRKRLRGPVQCNNATFGDPIHGVVKACYVEVYR